MSQTDKSLKTQQVINQPQPISSNEHKQNRKQRQQLKNKSLKVQNHSQNPKHREQVNNKPQHIAKVSRSKAVGPDPYPHARHLYSLLKMKVLTLEYM